MISAIERMKALQEKALNASYVSSEFDDPMQELHAEFLGLWEAVQANTDEDGDTLVDDYEKQDAIKYALVALNARAAEVLGVE